MGVRAGTERKLNEGGTLPEKKRLRSWEQSGEPTSHGRQLWEGEKCHHVPAV